MTKLERKRRRVRNERQSRGGGRGYCRLLLVPADGPNEPAAPLSQEIIKTGVMQQLKPEPGERLETRRASLFDKKTVHRQMT